MKRNGFSLIELLVVMALLGMLMTIVVPTSTRVIAMARRSVCANNLKELMRLISLVQHAKRVSGLTGLNDPPFMKKEYWPNRVAAENDDGRRITNPLFLCPDGIDVHGYGDPPLLYRSGIDLNIFVPFDETHKLCCHRRGVDEQGEPYSEYCIEENPGVPARWEHWGDGCPHWRKDWSTNDGIWRIYDRGEDGMRTVVLTFYDCGWPNELWVNGEFKWDNLTDHVGEVLQFRDMMTNYGYNTLLGDTPKVSPDTVVLMDANRLHIDPSAPTMTTDLNSLDTARHLGSINVLTADGAVNTVGPGSLYPGINQAPWTPADD
jgi:prepilin-type N-terminal cleavage/methylation domain-containing protein